MSRCFHSIALVLSFSASTLFAVEPQYADEGISIPAASADEAILESFDLDKAVEYLEQGTTAWQNKRKCVACHTNGAYMQMRPAMSAILGKPDPAHREFFVSEVTKFQKAPKTALLQGIKPTQIAYMAHGMAEWDKHVTGSLTDETRSALDLMLSVQSDDGSWGNINCWPPLESSTYHGATVAALAIATAPGFQDNLSEAQAVQVARLQKYLQVQEAPHDYGRLLLLWASTRMEGLIDDEKKQDIITMILNHQNDDGGWAMRNFATPDTWGGGSRAEKLKAEKNLMNPASDGHQTGLAVMVLRDAGVPASHPQIQKAIHWIKANQRTSGRWWTRSLNKDTRHFITYSGTFYSLMALHKCDALK
ncbi:MAG: hypothetical protein VX738_04265 [Planctomycetota bacterium]|nr:hypothetical protein [Planctomycetota bacterium]